MIKEVPDYEIIMWQASFLIVSPYTLLDLLNYSRQNIQYASRALILLDIDFTDNYIVVMKLLKQSWKHELLDFRQVILCHFVNTF